MVARPARLGLLVEAELKGVHWLRMFESALAAQARFWGGQGNLILPLTKGFTDSEVFWALADVFDADAFVTYAPTWREMADLDPGFYNQQTSAWRQEITERANRQEAERFISDADGKAAFHPRIPEEQVKLINRRLSPLSDPGPSDRQLEWFDGSNPAHWPFTEISEFEVLPEALTMPVIGASGAARRLLITALQGRAPDALRTSLETRGIDSIERRVDKYDVYGAVRDRNLPEHPGPWGLSMVGLSTFYTAGLLRAPVALVAGDSPWDFALFYALLRMTGRAWWLPSWLRRDAAYRMSLESSIQFDAPQEGREAVVVSTSSPETRDRTAETMLELHDERMDVADWRDVLPSEPMRVLATDTPGRARICPLVDGRVLELDTPSPSLVRTKQAAEMRWLSEARSADWAPVRNNALGRSLLTGGSDMVRTSRNGVAYFSTSSFIPAAASLESVVVRPSLRPLPLVGQVQELLRQQGWQCETSDKAIYARESMALFGGFDQLCDAIRDRGIRSIIDAYRMKRGVGALLSSDRRRYLRYANFEKLLQTDDARSVVEPLLDQGVLTRGVVFKCARCRQDAWHSAATPPDTFTCGRCGLAQHADRDAWFGTAEPVLSYRLAEVIFQLFEHDGELPLLAAKDAFGSSNDPLGRGYELRVTPPSEKTQEVDIFQSDGYRLWIGEASTCPQLDEKRIEFLSHLAGELDAYGILLATSEVAWSDATKEAANRLFPGPWPRLRLLAGIRTHPERDSDDESGA